MSDICLINKPVASLLWVLFFLAAQVNAVELENLYSAEVEVVNQETKERNRAVREGLAIVFVKVTGNGQAARNTALSKALRQASAYVQQYRYHVRDIDPGTVSENSSLDQQAQSITEKRYLKIRYDKLAVDKLLRSNGLPVWGSSRPQVLTWVGIEKNASRSVLIPEFQPELVRQLTQIAELRGIPLLFPLMDLKDQGAVSPAEIWGAFAEPVRAASQRYLADEILLIRLKMSEQGLTESSWSLLGKQQDQHWQVDGAGMLTAARQGLDQMADLVAQQYAPAGGDQLQLINLQVNGVSAIEDLFRIERFLKSQETVQRYQVRATWQDKVVFALSLGGGLPAFTQAIELSGLLLPEDMPDTLPISGPISGPITGPDSARGISTNMPAGDLPEMSPETSPENSPERSGAPDLQTPAVTAEQTSLSDALSQAVDADQSVPFKDVQLVYLLKK